MMPCWAHCLMKLQSCSSGVVEPILQIKLVLPVVEDEPKSCRSCCLPLQHTQPLLAVADNQTTICSICCIPSLCAEPC